MRVLGKTQKDILNALHEHGSWYAGCGWVWDTHSGTEKVLKSLESRKLVSSSKMRRGGDIYIVTLQGKVVVTNETKNETGKEK